MLRSTSSQQRVASMFADAAKARTYTTVLESTWRPEPYTNPCINSVEPVGLHALPSPDCTTAVQWISDRFGLF